MFLPTRNIEKHIYFLSKRTGMYVSEVTFDNVATHVEGFLMGIAATTETELYSSWRYWVGMRYRVWNPGWSWSRTIRSSVSSDEEAIKLLPKLFEEFLKKYEISTDKEIKKEHSSFEFDGIT